MGLPKIALLIGTENHPWAECLDCNADWNESSRTRDQAKRHAQAAGHRVKIVKSQVSIWGPTDG